MKEGRERKKQEKRRQHRPVLFFHINLFNWKIFFLVPPPPFFFYFWFFFSSRNGASLLQPRRQIGLDGLQVRVAANVLVVDEHVGHRALVRNLLERVLDGGAVGWARKREGNTKAVSVSVKEREIEGERTKRKSNNRKRNDREGRETEGGG